MSDEGEQLYGRQGIEQSQGYREMPSAAPDVNVDDGPIDEDVRRHLERPDQPEPVERSYVNSDDSGKRRPENETVEIDRAAEDLTAIRGAERREREDQNNRDLTEALDQLQRQVGQPQQAQQPEAQQQPEIEQPQPEQVDPAQIEATIAEADREIAKFLENPAVRQRVEQEFAAVNQAAHTQVENAKAAYGQAITQNAMAALAILAVDFPEYAGLSGPELQGALKVSNPQRAEAYRQRVGQVNNVVGAIQREVAQHQQQQQALHAQQYERAQDTFRQYAAEQDARVLANDSPETVAAIRNGLLAEAKAAGISEKELLTVYNTNSAMRHSFVQNLLADGMRYRLTQRSLAQAVYRPVPAVQRPGVSQPHSSDDGAYAAIERQFRGKDLNPKQAAELLIARRGARH